jgi:orotidine-5'-phosphate decarboxylase
MTSYSARLNAAVLRMRTPALVGLDPRYELLPPDIVARATKATSDRCSQRALACEEFCRRIIDVVAPLVPAVKPQAAFFEEYGPAGCQALHNVIRHARRAGLIVICDAKRGDIGSTAEAYARAYLAGADADAAPWGADALTVNAYLGADTLEPFAELAVQRGAGIYVLVRTSNPGAGAFQDAVSDGQALYQRVARTVDSLAQRTCGGEQFGAVGAVVGATWPAELAQLRAAMPHAPLLVPGYGSQGGTAADVAAAFREDGLGALVNNSRGINFAWTRKPYSDQFGPGRWEEAVEAATRDMIVDLAANTPAGRLRGEKWDQR